MAAIALGGPGVAAADAAGPAIGLPPLPGGALVVAPGDDDWSLERRDDDARLVEQRLAKLRAQPFDTAQWRALVRALGPARLAARLDADAAAAPRSLAAAVLAARARLRLRDDPSGAAELLGPALDRARTEAPRWVPKLLDEHVDALTGARRTRDAIALLRAEAAALDGVRGREPAALALRQRALAIAERSNDRAVALAIAQDLAARRPADVGYLVRLARAAAAAGERDVADGAYGRALAAARSDPERRALQLERSRAALEAGQFDAAAAGAWAVLEGAPELGVTPAKDATVRGEAWDVWVGAHARGGAAAAGIAQLEPALIGPRANEAAAWRALARLRAGAGIDAVDAWARAVALAPRDLAAQRSWIDALALRGDLRAAADVALAVCRDRRVGADEAVRIALELATRAIRGGEPELALSLARAAQERAGRSLDRQLAVLDFYNLEEEPALALGVAERAAATHPRDADALLALGEQQYQMGQITAALETWARLPNVVRPSHAGWARWGEVLSEHGRTTEAVRALETATRLAPREPRYWRLLAVLVEEGMQRPTKALALWQRVRELATAPDDALLRDEARTRQVDILIEGGGRTRGELQKAEDAASLTLARGTPLAGAIEDGRFLAELYTRAERYSRAVAVHQRLVEIAPTDPERLRDLAAAQRRAGQLPSAMQTLEQLLELDPSRGSDVLAELSELAFEAGDTERAAAAAARAAELGVRDGLGSAAALVRLGELQAAAGDLDGASRSLEAARTVAPQDAAARLRLAELELTRGRNDAARKLLREVLERGGPPEVVERAGLRALDLAELDGDTISVFELALSLAQRDPESAEPRELLLAALERTEPAALERWLRGSGGGERRDPAREAALRQPLLAATGRGSVGARMRAADHLGRLALPGTAPALARLGLTLQPPRDATRTVIAAHVAAQVAAVRAAGELDDAAALPTFAEILGTAAVARPTYDAAAWALVRASDGAGRAMIATSRMNSSEPKLAALACIATYVAARRGEALELPEATAQSLVRHATRYGYGKPDERRVVVEACALASAAITPDARADRWLAAVASRSTEVAAIAAWRVGLQRGPVRAEEITALVRRAVGPAGPARDAAGEALARRLTQPPAPAPDVSALPQLAGDDWTWPARRWLAAEVASGATSLDPAVLAGVDAAAVRGVRAAAEGTAAERLALAQRGCAAGSDLTRLTADPACSPAALLARWLERADAHPVQAGAAAAPRPQGPGGPRPAQAVPDAARASR